MGTVSHLLKSKGHNIIHVTPDDTVYRALEIMVKSNVSALLAMDGERLVGIITERDYARKVILKGKASKETKVEEIMTRNVTTVDPATSIDHCMRLMTGNFFRHLPVLQEGKVVGIISIGDVVKYVIEEQQFIIRNMETYISQ